MTLIDRPAAAEARADTAVGGNLAEADAVALAARLDALLRELPTLEARIDAISEFIPGRIAFSSSLGIEDQAITHAIATREARVDVFTLDTGRHFPETLETLFETEGRYGIKIHLLAGRQHQPATGTCQNPRRECAEGPRRTRDDRDLARDIEQRQGIAQPVFVHSLAPGG